MAEPKRQNLKVVGEDQAPRGRRDGGEPSGVAAALRGARLRAGIELRDAADALRIRYPYLQAIEEGRFQDLPGATYALGFVRAYAEFLELDGTEIVRQFKEEGRDLNRRTALVFPEPVQEGRFPGAGVLLVALALAGAAYGGWYYWQHRPAHVALGVPPVPEPLAVLAPATPPPSRAPASEAAAPAAAPVDPRAVSAPAVTPSARETAAATGDGPTAAPAPAPAVSAPAPATTVPILAAPAPAPATTVSEAPAGAAPLAHEAKPSVPPPNIPTPKPAETAAAGEAPRPQGVTTGASSAAPATRESPAAAIPAAPEQVASVKPSEPHVYGENNTDSRIALTARQDSWVQVRDKENNVVWTRILRPGDSYKVPNQPGLTLLTGNAGALEVTVDGKPAPALGAPGAVRRNITLDPEKLAAGATGGQ